MFSQMNCCRIAQIAVVVRDIVANQAVLADILLSRQTWCQLGRLSRHKMATATVACGGKPGTFRRIRFAAASRMPAPAVGTSAVCCG
jgi:hypothetical protein